MFWAGLSDCPKLYPCIEISFHIFVQSTERSQFMRGQGHWYNATDKLSEYMWFSLCLSLQSRFAYEENIWSFEFLFCEKQDLCCSYKLMCGLLFSNVSHTHQCRDTIEILTFIGIFARSEFLYSNDLTDS